jgi:ring-1,2-phenylacetyl-CoA epoxidase subunit PaaD
MTFESLVTAKSTPLTLDEVWQALSRLSDPEIPVVSLQEMGILRDVQLIDEQRLVQITITPTYSGCPAMSQIEDDIVSSVEALGWQARVITQLAPAWTTDWMSDEAKEKLRAYGIAPPAACHSASSQHVLSFMTARDTVDVACPRCGSVNTTETSHFGSTACKALYKCLSCMEPFDYFKPY